jgi:leucyl aminopeptidase
MSLEYRLQIDSVSKETGVIDLFFEKEDTKSYVSSLVPAERYQVLYFKKHTIYLDVDKAELSMAAIRQFWDNLPISRVILSLPENLLEDKDALEHILSNIVRSFFFNIYKEKATIIITHRGPTKKDAVATIISMIQKVQVARMLSMLPANEAYPEKIAARVQKLFQKIPKVTTKIWKHTYLYKHGFDLIRAVGEGAKNPPCMLIIERLVDAKKPTVCILGKGITFDSGGLSIKGYRSIMKMKFDKIGAINGSMSLMHLLEQKEHKDVNFIGVFPFAENAVDARSIHPGDVVKSFLGKTVEILDPDAEGRLVLGDALGYVHKYKPDLIIDIATLTGHAERINCWHYGYYYAQPDTLKVKMEKLTNQIGERMIPMPTWGDYKDVLNSTVADLVNSPLKCSDAFVAALFLKEFVPKGADWIHIDVTHEFDGSVPKGNGIRSMIHIVEEYLSKKK